MIKTVKSSVQVNALRMFKMSRRVKGGRWKIFIYVDYDEYEINVVIEKDGKYYTEHGYSLDKEEIDECIKFISNLFKEIRKDYEKRMI